MIRLPPRATRPDTFLPSAAPVRSNAVSMIGKGLLLPGEKISLGTDAVDPSKRVATPFGIDLQGDAAKVSVKILDASGAVVRSFELGAQDTGVLTLDWDEIGRASCRERVCQYV